MSNPLDRWEASIEAGKTAEAAIAITFYLHLGMVCEDNTKERLKNPDLRGNTCFDVKILKSPYPKEITPAGLKQGEHLTLDASNVEDYPDTTMLLMIVDYTGTGVQTKGLYYITAGRVKEILKLNHKRLYSRSQRSAKDKVRKIGISTKECGRIAFPGKTLAESVDEILAAQKHPLLELVKLEDIE